MEDEKCNVCGEPRSAHVKTEKGPLTHPREARGEGTYQFVSYWEGFDFREGEYVRRENWRFVSSESETKVAP